MEKLNLTNSYNLYTRDLENYGGEFSLFEKLKLKGIGSAKLVYEKGIDEIDKIILESGNKVAILNFELLKNGLLLRYNINNEIGCYAFRLDEICSINFLAIPIQIRVKRFGRYITKIVYRGELELINNNEKVKLYVLTKDFKSILSFLRKPLLVEKLNFKISNNEPEKDESMWLEKLDFFI